MWTAKEVGLIFCPHDCMQTCLTGELDRLVRRDLEHASARRNRTMPKGQSKAPPLCSRPATVGMAC